ncbi:MAG: TolC family protein [Desulfotalea sp.]
MSCVTLNTTFAQESLIYNDDLAYLETKIFTSNSVQSEIAILEELQAELAHQQDVSGWKIVGSAGGGYTNEELTSGDRSEYYPTRLSAGLSYPLFGKYMDEQSKLLDMQAGADNRYLNIEISRREALEKLRTSYILLWGAEQRFILADAFLKQNVQNIKNLQKRKDRGLLLPSDYYDFITIQNRVVRERRTSQSSIEQTRRIIFLLTGEKINRRLTSPPSLPNISGNLEKAIASVNQNPEVMLFQNMVDLQLKKAPYSSSDIKGSVTIQGFASTSDDVNTDAGYGGLLTFDVVMPIDPFAADSSSDLLTSKRLKRYQKELDVKIEGITFEIRERIRKLDSISARRSESISQLQSSTAYLREKLLRLDKLDGDVLAQYQQARYKYYRSANIIIDAEIEEMLAKTAVLRFFPTQGERDSMSTLTTSIIKPFTDKQDNIKIIFRKEITDRAFNKNRKITFTEEISNIPFRYKPIKAIYLWNGDDFLQGNLSLKEIREKQIGKILLSLNGKELKNLTNAKGKENIINAIAFWQKNNIEICLLLGEASWILPQHRSKLMEILASVNKFNFNSVHLDMEPSQLDTDKYGLTYLSSQLLHTLQLATTISDHPIEASFHPRLFSTDITGVCFGCGLENLNLHRVVIMDYRTNEEEVEKRISILSKKYKKLKIALAQSAETSLGPKNSYAHIGIDGFEKAISSLQDNSRTKGWLGDIYIQDWASYKQLVKESRVQ